MTPETRSPEVLILHTAAATHWIDADALRDEVEAAIPDIDLRLARTPPQSEALIEEVEIVLSASLPSSLLDEASNLRFVQALSAGVDFYDTDRLEAEGIVLASAAGIHAEAIAEQVLGYLLIFARNIHVGMRQQYRHVWERYEGGELEGSTLGVIGVGAIGSRVAELGRAFGMEVLGVKRHPEDAPDAVDECYGPDDRFEVLSRSDYVVIACPLTEETRGMIGREEIGAMPAEGVLVNVARGGIVDEDALVHCLRQHVIRGAGLDVYGEEPHPADSPLWDLSNVVMTPHMAGSTPMKEERVANIFARNYAAYLDGDEDAYLNRVV